MKPSQFAMGLATLVMGAVPLGCGGRTSLDVRQGLSSLDAASHLDAQPDRSDGGPRDLGDARDLRDAAVPAKDGPVPAFLDAAVDFVPSDCGGGRFDPISGLCWQDPRCSRSFDQDSWQAAVDYCETLSLGGRDDWRLPTQDDLLALLDDCDSDHNCQPCAKSRRCSALFGTDGATYWSSSSNNPELGDAWTVNFSDGTSYYNYGRPEQDRVRCVRPGP